MTDIEEITVRVKCVDEMKFLTVPVKDLEPIKFAHHVSRVFKVVVKNGDCVRFFDNLDTPISEANFLNVLKTFHRGSCFFINVMFQIETSHSPSIITPKVLIALLVTSASSVRTKYRSTYIFRKSVKMLEQYFIENDKKKLISECKSTTEMGFDLTQSQKVECVNTVADYGIKVFGLNPLPHQYKMLALAAIGFIHGLISTTGDATDLLIRSSKTGTTGRLYNRIRYLRNATKTNDVAGVDEEPTPSTLQKETEQSNEHSMNDLFWLKTVVVSKTNMKEIEHKLQSTRKIRDEMVRKETIELLQEFPFFFTHPLLILNDFALKFEGIQKELQPNALCENWRSMTTNSSEVLNKYYPNLVFETEWSEDVEVFLMLIRLLPFKASARSVASNETFVNSIKRLLVFQNTSQVSSTVMEKHQNTQPFIVAKGVAKNCIGRYSIFVDNNEINLPDDFSVTEVIDIFFKLHHVFEIKFDERLENAMFFIKNYIYKMKDKTRKPTTKMIELYGRLFLFHLL